jgi:hypothetical protein
METSFIFKERKFSYIIHQNKEPIPLPNWSMIEDPDVVFPPRKKSDEITDEWLAEEMLRAFSRDRQSRRYKESAIFRDGLEDVVVMNKCPMIIVFDEDGYFAGKICFFANEQAFTLNVMFLYGTNDRYARGDRSISSAQLIWYVSASYAIKRLSPLARVLIVMPRDTIYGKLLALSCIMVELQKHRDLIVSSPIQSKNGWKEFDALTRSFMQRVVENEEAQREPDFGALFLARDLLL